MRNNEPNNERTSPSIPGKSSSYDPSHPTATAPDSVQESVYEEAEYAGKDGKDAADPPLGADKPKPAEPDYEPASDRRADDDVAHGSQGADVYDAAMRSAMTGGAAVAPASEPSEQEPQHTSALDSDEAADAGETQAEATDARGGRHEDRAADDIISLDVPD